MILYKTSADINKYLSFVTRSGKPIGFVPTMGALHDGHISLINHSKKKGNITVCSIFVNPTQFNDPKDFAKYPVTLEKDLLLLEKAGCDIVFLPTLKEIYPNETDLQKHFDLGYLETIFEGKYRPGHFQGVCQVVSRLLEIIKPSTLYLGRKDYQQCMVIKKLIALSGWDIQVVMADTLREASGLAMSSRNLRLSEKDRQSAAAIYQTLQYLSSNIQSGDLADLLNKAGQMLNTAGFEKTDYIAIAHAETLEPMSYWDGQAHIVGLVAAFIGGVRLIDNMPLQ
jgi:pantoate--beta-alanine ligase